MKHSFLRRVGAMFLALALVLPMAVTNAWAATGDGFAASVKASRNGKDLTLSDLLSLDSSVDLTAQTIGEVNSSSTIVTYSWSQTGNVVEVSPASGRSVTIKPTAEGAGTVTLVATCSWTENGTRNDKPVTVNIPVNVTSVPLDSLTPKSYSDTMKTGETQELSVTYTPDNATVKTVSWSVNPADIVRVTDTSTPTNPGTASVTALKAGTAYVTAQGANGRFTTFALTVIDAGIPEVTVLPEQGDIPTLTIGATYQLHGSATADPAPTKTEWKSSNSSTATIDPNTGLITCLRAGTVTFTYTATGTKMQNGKPTTATVSESRTITIINPQSTIANSMSAKGPTTLSLSAGEKTQLAVNVSPATAQVTWSSDNRAVASVDPATGMVTAVAPGRASITATAQKSGGGQLTVTYDITVMGRAIDIEFNSYDGISPDTGKEYVQFNSDNSGRTKTLSTTLRSENGEKTNTNVVFTSSDTSIVTVNARGEYAVDLTISSARTPGKATVTATVYDKTTNKPVLLGDGVTPMAAEMDVIVSGFTLSDSALVMYEGEAKSLSIANTYGDAANASASNVQWISSDSSIVSMESGTLNAWSRGTATITGTYTTNGREYKATCKVTVTEDAGTIVNAGSANAGNSIKIGTSNVISQINAIARERTGSQMEYLTGIFISPTQGVVYNSYTSEADTGSGVSMTERYNVNRTTPAKDYIGALSFVPAKTYSGEARISYIGYANGQPVSGVISVNVNGLGENGADVTYTSNAAEVTFLADDFNTISLNKTGRTLKYVTFTPPQASVGTLYENYTNATHPGQKVVATTQYNRNGSPNINSVTFVPASGYSGAARISYRAVDSNNDAYTGVVTINVNAAASTSDPADIHYSAPQDGWATFRAADFASASLRTIGEPLSYVRFALPNSSEGTLFYNYRGFGNYDSDVASTTNYYQSGTPSLSSVSFVPATTSSGQTAISYTGYSTRGTTFTGTVYVGEGSGTQTNPGTVFYDYTVNSGSSVNLNATAFNNAFRAAMGADLSYIRFNSLPASSQGTLRYRTGSSSYYSNVSTTQSFYRIGTTSAALLIGNISFLANSAYTGVVRIPYTGYDASGRSYAGEITIQVNPNTIYYNGTTANPLRIYSSQISGACGSFTSPLSYIEFTSLPSSDAGRVYFGYNGYGTGTQVSSGAKYYATGSPSIDQLSFVPKGRYTGDATAAYTAYSTSGEKMSGQITFRISAATSSGYFTDMSNYGWAAASVDYLYQNNVTNGMTATTFGPSLQIRRCDFILMLHRIFNFRGGSAANPGFADVPANSYYAQAVSAAKQMGIVSGDGRNFMPNNPITRQDAMVMVKNAMAAAGKIQGSASTTILNSFPDGGSVSSYARDAVSTLVQMGAVNGSNGMLNPRMSITRAEAAVILHFIMTA